MIFLLRAALTTSHKWDGSVDRHHTHTLTLTQQHHSQPSLMWYEVISPPAPVRKPWIIHQWAFPHLKWLRTERGRRRMDGWRRIAKHAKKHTELYEKGLLVTYVLSNQCNTWFCRIWEHVQEQITCDHPVAPGCCGCVEIVVLKSWRQTKRQTQRRLIYFWTPRKLTLLQSAGFYF